jgi:hypothetical protein
MNETQLSRTVNAYFIERQLVWPSVYEAMGWAVAEVGEAYEALLMASSKEWKRNDPEKEKKTVTNVDFGEELGDAIMMFIVAGLTMGVDPIEQMLFKMERKVPGVTKT